MIKTERIDDLEFNIYKVEEIKKPMNAGDIASVIAKFPAYKLIVYGIGGDDVYNIRINHSKQLIELNHYE